MDIRIPFGRDWLTGSVADERVQRVVRCGLDDYVPEISQEELIKNAMGEGVFGPPLYELAKEKRKVVLIASDHTRPVPSRLIVPEMLRQIRKGNPAAEVTILIATGCHRETHKEELVHKFGPDIVEKEHIVIHDCDSPDMCDLGNLHSGGPCRINSIAARADLLVAEGFIEPHFFAGFSGGRKSVLPGVASRDTVYYNHCSSFIDSENARHGRLEGNPIHADMLEAAQKAGLSYIVNVVMNSDYQVIGAFVGDMQAAHHAGTAFLRKLCRQKTGEADIVLTSNNGYPLDQNIYQAVKGMATAENICLENGVIIMAAACEDGVGGEAFYRLFRENNSSSDILNRIRNIPPKHTAADQWQAQIFARILSRNHVILISRCAPQIVRDLHMIPAEGIDDAIRKADKLLGAKKKMVIIPDGISSIVEKKWRINGESLRMQEERK